ncbi:MAG: flagellar export chaperone FliS [Planctomycetes bacterium]|nr:flagellar export chaperone FliS [Planctomycetota bacterium]
MDGIATFQDNAVSTQRKGRLIAMLYERAIKFMILAIMEMMKKNHKAKDRHINKALDIIDELNAALDMDPDSEIAHNLRKRYIFMSNRLSLANIKDDPQMICDVIKLTEELNKIWKVFN